MSNLDKISENYAGLNFSMKKYNFSIGVNYKEITNPVYFDNYAIARQYKGVIPVASAFLKSWAPGFIVAAEPQATPQRAISLKFLPAANAQTMPATIESPAPTVLNFLTVGAAICS